MGTFSLVIRNKDGGCAAHGASRRDSVGAMGQIMHFQALVHRDLRHGAQVDVQDVHLVQLASVDVKAEQSEIPSLTGASKAKRREARREAGWPWMWSTGGDR
jgi:hypothetical protein